MGVHPISLVLPAGFSSKVCCVWGNIWVAPLSFRLLVVPIYLQLIYYLSSEAQILLERFIGAMSHLQSPHSTSTMEGALYNISEDQQSLIHGFFILPKLGPKMYSFAAFLGVQFRPLA